jgi:hypothetical protein
LVPRGTQPALRPVALRGQVWVDPREQDFFRVAIEQRHQLDARTDLSAEEKEWLSAFLKVLANSAGYGIYAEMNPHILPHNEKQRVTVYGNWETPFTAAVHTPEEPGAYCFPPFAACIAGAARLMLALLERLVTDAGGAYAACDTDSMDIVATEHGGLVPCPGGPHRMPGQKRAEAIQALSWAAVEGIRARFATLNPYDPDAIRGSVLKLEQENLGEDDRQRQLWCYAISAKRYALFAVDATRRPHLVKASEHGLGHLLDPTDPDNGDGAWMGVLWDGVLTEELGHPYPRPSWLDRPAVGRITASSPELLRPFAQLNRGKPYAEQVKPFNFLLTAFVAPLGHPAGVDLARFHLIAPYESDPRKWLRMRWTDLYSTRTYRITNEASLYETNAVRIKTYRDVLDDYRTHPETKSAGSDGKLCTRRTVGLLQRLWVVPSAITHVGKESNKLEEVQTGLVHDPDEVYTEYRDPRENPEWETVVNALKGIPRQFLIEQTGLSRSTLKAVCNRRSMPHRRNREALIRAAKAYTQRSSSSARPTEA